VSTLAAILAHAEAGPTRLAAVVNGHELTYGAFAAMIRAVAGFLETQDLPHEGAALVSTFAPFDSAVLGYALRGLGLTTLALRDAAEAQELDGLDIACLTVVAGDSREDLLAVGRSRGWRAVTIAPGLTPPAREPAWAAEPGGHILMTSGTTGRSKKVLVTPQAEAGNHRLRRRVWGFDEDSLVNLFDFGAWTAIGHNAPAAVWLAGGAVSLSTGDGRARSMLRRDLTHAAMTPFLLELVLREAPADMAQNPGLVLIASGGAITPEVAQAARTRISPRLYDGLSCTEGGLVTFTPLETPDDLVWKRVIPGREVLVVDEAGEALPAGQVGRLGVRIIDDVRGYIGDPETTVAFFIDEVFLTGDLAVMREDGRFALRGRASDVLNIDGSKFSVAPIEEAIRAALDAKAACLIQAPDAAGRVRLHLALEGARPMSETELAAALGPHLTRFDQVQVHNIEALPRAGLGKVDRVELRRIVAG
jgi:acyl-coenzyme A synthetase/AMP-(fatty) acid ligase